MREILFRGKAKAGYKWITEGEWIEGSLFYSNDENGTVYQIATSYLSASKDESVMVVAYEVDPETVCQYTGLTDKNSRKIFEGDIVQDYPFKAIVKFGEFENQVLKNIGFNLDWTDGLYYRQDLPFWAGKIEVIGNIFDSPEPIENKYLID